MSAKPKDGQAGESATMASLKTAAAAGADVPEHAQAPSDGVEPWERQHAAGPDDLPDGVEIVDAELVDPVGPYDDRAAELARREARRDTTVAVRSHPATQALDRLVSAVATEGTEADWAQGEIIAQVMAAESIMDVLAPAEAIHGRDLVGIPLIVHGVKYQRSDYSEGSPFYAVMDCEREDSGARIPVTIGAQSIIAQLMRLAQLDAFPQRVVIEQATKRPTAAGYWPLRLALPKTPPPARS